VGEGVVTVLIVLPIRIVYFRYAASSPKATLVRRFGNEFTQGQWASKNSESISELSPEELRSLEVVLKKVRQAGCRADGGELSASVDLSARAFDCLASQLPLNES
jgi:hypothetical protein